MRSWGCRGAPALRRSRAPIASSPRSITPTQQERSEVRGALFRTEFGQRDHRRRGQAQAVRSRRDRRRGQAALSGLSGGGDPRGARAAPAAVSRSRTFRTGGAGAGGFGGGGFEDILNSMFGGGGVRGARPGAGNTFEFDPGGIALDLDLSVAMTVSLEEVGQGRGKARPAADRQGTQCQDSRRRHRRPADPAEGAGRDRARPPPRRSPDHGQHRAASVLQGRRQRSAGRSADHAV